MIHYLPYILVVYYKSKKDMGSELPDSWKDRKTVSQVWILI
jgi:hypothetical protein